jgi:hypothetical protein
METLFAVFGDRRRAQATSERRSTDRHRRTPSIATLIAAQAPKHHVTLAAEPLVGDGRAMLDHAENIDADPRPFGNVTEGCVIG